MPTYHSTWEFSDEDGDGVSHEAEIEITMTHPGEPPIYSPPPGDPGSSPEFRIDKVRLYVAQVARTSFKNQTSETRDVVIELTEEQFMYLSPDCEKILEAAYEWAHNNTGEFP